MSLFLLLLFCMFGIMFVLLTGHQPLMMVRVSFMATRTWLTKAGLVVYGFISFPSMNRVGG